MMRVAAVVTLCFTLAGCYHATINTGRQPSPSQYERWAHSWIYGLVPPSLENAGERCPNGPASVETQISFVNGLVGFLTFQIYTPMTIKVVCAQ
jgi:hypothetical protein